MGWTRRFGAAVLVGTLIVAGCGGDDDDAPDAAPAAEVDDDAASGGGGGDTIVTESADIDDEDIIVAEASDEDPIMTQLLAKIFGLPASFITEDQNEKLKLLNKKTKVPVAEFIRQGIDMVLDRYKNQIPGQMSF